MRIMFFPRFPMKKDSWLYSDSFLKRAFAIWGYHFVANIIISVPFVLLWALMMGMFMAAAFKHVPGERGKMMQYDRGEMMDWQDDEGMQMHMQVR